MTLLVIATSLGLLWFGFLTYEAVKRMGYCQKHGRKFILVGYDERDFCQDCYDESRGKFDRVLSGKDKVPGWLKNARDFSLKRFFTHSLKNRERFDGILRNFRMAVEPLCSYNSIDKIGTEDYRFHKIPVKGGEDDMAKGKSPKKEKKKPSKKKK